MATIANMAVKLTADTGQFVGKIDKATETAKKLEKEAADIIKNTRTPIENYRAQLEKLGQMKQQGLIDSQTYNRALKMERDELGKGALSFKTLAIAAVGAGAAIATGLAYGLARLGIEAAKNIVDTLKLARSLDTTTESIIALREGARAFGTDAATVDAALLSLNSDLSAAANSGGAMTDVLSRLGLDAKKLNAGSATDAFKEIAQAIADLPTPAERASAAVQIFHDKAAALLPLLSQGAAGIDKAAASAEKAGLNFSKVDAGKVEDATRAMEELGKIQTSIGQTVAIEVAPLVSRAAEEFQKLGITGKTVSGWIVDGMKIVVVSIAAVIDIGRVFVAAFKFMQLSIAGFTILFARAYEKLFTFVAERSPIKAVRDQAAQLRDIAHEVNEDFTKDAKQITGELKDQFDNPTYARQALDFFGRLKDGAGEAAKASEKLKNGLGAVPNAVKNAALYEKGARVFEENQTPLQQFQNQVNELNALVNSGAVSWDTYAKATAKAVTGLEQAHQLNSLARPGLAERGSKEAYNAITENQVRDERRLKENPQDRVARVLQQSQEIEKEQLVQMRRVADAVSNQKVVRIGN